MALGSNNFDKFKNKHEGEWEYNKKLDAFIDEYDEVVAYRYDGILYYVQFDNKQHVPVNLNDIDTPSIPKDVWYLILSRMSYIPHIIPFLDCCVASAKSASLVIRERGDKLLETYGPIFKQLLNMREMSYLDFFEWCDNGGITEEWLPFDVLFRLPIGTQTPLACL